METRKRVYKEFNRTDFKKDIVTAKNKGLFSAMHETEDENKAWEIFEHVFVSVLDKHAPIKVIQNRNNYVPYINPELRKLMTERDILKETAAKLGTVEAFEAYKNARNEVSTKLKTAESDNYKTKFENRNATAAEIWRGAYQLLGRVRSQFPTQIMARGILFSKPVEMATEVNEFFLSKIRNLKENIQSSTPEETTAELKSFLKSKTIPSGGFKLREIENSDVRKLINKMKGKKSHGMDWMCGYSLKIVAEDLLPEIKILINLSLRNNRFINRWKFSRILPGYKNKGSKFELKSYRPISNLSEVSKLAERVVYNQLYDYLKENDLIHPNHHGFLKHCSTATALQQIYDIWLQSLDKGNMAAALFLDLSAGFDVIDHDILIKKLKLYKFSSGAVEWFASYLINRYQCVQVESSFSPLIFLLFIMNSQT